MIAVTREMISRAASEMERREPYIRHHFETKALGQDQTSMIGFVGEFCARLWLGLSWEDGIRESYETIDTEDIVFGGLRIDAKTETVPRQLLSLILERTRPSNETYGNRLYHVGQVGNLDHYDVILWGVFERSDRLMPGALWSPIGWTTPEKLLTYPHGRHGPRQSNGQHIVYPDAAYQIPTADLSWPDDLLQMAT